MLGIDTKRNQRQWKKKKQKIVRDLWRENLKVVIIKIFGTFEPHSDEFQLRSENNIMPRSMIKKHFIFFFVVILARPYEIQYHHDDFVSERAVRMKNCWMITRDREEIEFTHSVVTSPSISSRFSYC